jgi:uncharacterized LabA/DUF88 family protein
VNQLTDRLKSIAVLIDADNVPLSAIPAILYETVKLGRVDVRRAYGDFTMPTLHGWRDEMRKRAIRPMQQFRNINGKCVTDSALIIDAMDLLHSGQLSGFCIVSSDSDFTQLAVRIREHGLPAYGFGERKKAVEAYVKACTRFFYTDQPPPATRPESTPKKAKSTAPKPA